MIDVKVLDGRPKARSGYKVDLSRGDRVRRVSSEWFARPDDERYISLSELHASVQRRAEGSRSRTVESAAIRVEVRRDAEALSLLLPDAPEPVAPTHWSFGQLASLVGAPSAYLRQLPATLAGINLQYGLSAHRAEQVKTLEAASGRLELRAVTGPDYGRIYDRELVAAVQRIADDGTGDTRWNEAAPALTRFADSSPTPFVEGIRAARERIVARSDEDRTEFLRKRGFGKAEAARIVETVLAEEGCAPTSIFDFVQGITAVARGKAHQDARLDLEGRARKLLELAV